MHELKLPYKVRKYIKENKDEIDNCILDAVSGCNKTDLYITDLDVVVDYILDNRIFSTSFYQGIITYCKAFLEDEGYYVTLFTEEPDELDRLYKLEEYGDNNFKSMMTVFVNEKDYKRDKRLSSGARLLGFILHLFAELEEN